MRLTTKILYLFIILISGSCGSPKELTMPYFNYFYSGDRLFPIKINDDEISIRVWINLGTSTERVITVSRDSSELFSGTLIQYGEDYKKNLLKKGYSPSKSFFKTIEIKPKNGFENFFATAEKLKFIDVKNQEELVVSLHRPISIFVIEYKINSEYNVFKFYSADGKAEGKEYQEIQDFLLQEFPVFEK